MKILKAANTLQADCLKCGASFELKNKDWKKVNPGNLEAIEYDFDSMGREIKRFVKYKTLEIVCPICKDRIIVKREKV